MHRHAPLFGLLLGSSALGCSGAGDSSPVGDAFGPDITTAREEIRDGTPTDIEDVVELEVFSGGTWQTLCSGTALRNDVILTAQHCLGAPYALPFSGNFRLFEVPGASVGGAPENWDWRVRTVGGATAQVRYVHRLVEQNYTPAFREAAGFDVAQWEDATQLRSDAALLVLDRRLTFYGEGRNHVRDISRLSSAAMNLSVHLCTGYGANSGPFNSTTGAGPQRSGLVQVFQPSEHEGDSRYLQYLPNYETEQGVIPMIGDSGGPCFHLHDGYWFQVASVHSYQNTTCTGCDADHYAAQQTSAEIFRSEALVMMDFFQNVGGWSFSSMPSDGRAVTPSGTIGGTPRWRVVSGELREDSNAHVDSPTFEGPMFLRDGVYSNPSAQVRIRSSDDDAAGLVIRYYDPDHYYRASFDESRRYFRIYKRSGGVTTILAHRSVALDHSNGHLLTFRAFDGRLRATLSGPGVNVTLDATDNSEDALMSGRVGVYDWGLTDAHFDDLQINVLTAPF